jgi:hypothetical protein
VKTDDRSTYVVLILAGLLPLTCAVAAGRAIGAGATLCYLMVGLGVLGMVGALGRVPRSPPEARARLPSRRRSR